MKTTAYLLLLIGSMSGLNFCTSGPKKTETVTTAKTDSAQKASMSITEELAPPDSDYTGDYFKKYDNGIVKVRGLFRFGKRHGTWTYFYPNGLKWSEAYFENNKMNGESSVYHENGKLYYSGFYKQDIPVGTWKFYDSTGVLAATKVYDSIPKVKEPK
ncbi:MAG: toxin-antitoxin system YwqK family antitoxin [Bacteroidia bacterium]